MKNKLLILILLFVFSVKTIAQIGINTVNPQGTFHVDGGKDNPVSGTITKQQQSNDFIVTASGNVGIGTINPQRKLEIVSSTSPSLRIVDGNQKEGYVLVSDDDGNGSWMPLTKVIKADFSPNGYSGTTDIPENNYKYTGVSIDLPPGKWLVLTSIKLETNPIPANGNGVWTRLSWSRKKSGQSDTLSEIIGPLNSGVCISQYGLAIGSTIINNKSVDNATYYLNLTHSDIIGNYNGNWVNLCAESPDNSIIAYPAN